MKKHFWLILNYTSQSLASFGVVLKNSCLIKYKYGRHAVDFFLFLFDVKNILFQYREVFGHLPTFLFKKTFNERIQYSKIFSRNQNNCIYVDKILVRNFVEKRIGSYVLNEIFWSGKDLSEIDPLTLPEKFVIKSNNSSGKNIFVKNVKNIDWYEVLNTTRQWLKQDYSLLYSEWQYRWVKPMLLIENLLEDCSGNVPIDYKFFCFDGRVGMVQVDVNRFVNHTRVLFDREFNRLPATYVYEMYTDELKKPTCYDEMLKIAEDLSRGESFLRVDLYDYSGRPVFGEITLHPEAGLGKFNPPVLDKKLGDMWVDPSRSLFF